MTNAGRSTPCTNVVIGIIHARRDFDDPETREDRLAIRRAWRAMTDQPFWIWEHYPFTHRSAFTPIYFPRSIAAGLRSMRDEYYRLFYGPAAGQMQAFIEYSEANRRYLRQDVEKIDRTLELLDAAVAAAPAASVYGQRIALVVAYLEQLRAWRDQLVRGREGVPVTQAPVIQGAELMLETQSHSYYQIAVNAVGAVVDLDRNLGQRNDVWTSLAEVAAHRGDDYWSVELRIPVTGEQTPGDPLHELAGWRPSADAPWHLQVGRQRLRGEDREWTTWSPTGSNFHDIMRFGRLE